MVPSSYTAFTMESEKRCYLIMAFFIYCTALIAILLLTVPSTDVLPTSSSPTREETPAIAVKDITVEEEEDMEDFYSYNRFEFTLKNDSKKSHELLAELHSQVARATSKVRQLDADVQQKVQLFTQIDEHMDKAQKVQTRMKNQRQHDEVAHLRRQKHHLEAGIRGHYITIAKVTKAMDHNNHVEEQMVYRRVYEEAVLKKKGQTYSIKRETVEQRRKTLADQQKKLLDDCNTHRMGVYFKNMMMKEAARHEAELAKAGAMQNQNKNNPALRVHAQNYRKNRDFRSELKMHDIGDLTQKLPDVRPENLFMAVPKGKTLDLKTISADHLPYQLKGTSGRLDKNDDKKQQPLDNNEDITEGPEGHDGQKGKGKNARKHDAYQKLDDGDNFQTILPKHLCKRAGAAIKDQNASDAEKIVTQGSPSSTAARRKCALQIFLKGGMSNK